MDIVFSDFAEKELERLPQELKSLFLKHFEKMIVAAPRKRMKLHCFGSHKEYERWYRSYKQSLYTQKDLVSNFQPTGPTGSDILKVPSRIRLFSSSARLTALSRSD